MRSLLAIVVLAACACPAKPSTGPGAGTGSTAGSGVVPAGGCEGARAKVEQLYRAEAEVKEPARVDEAVADNTTMVMNDCAQDPTRVSACIASVHTVPDLERRCLVPLDDEGSEGDALAR